MLNIQSLPLVSIYLRLRVMQKVVELLRKFLYRRAAIFATVNLLTMPGVRLPYNNEIMIEHLLQGLPLRLYL